MNKIMKKIMKFKLFLKNKLMIKYQKIKMKKIINNKVLVLKNPKKSETNP